MRLVYQNIYQAYKYTFLIFLLFQCFISDKIVAQCYHKNEAFQSGEQLDYNVYYHFGLLKIKLADVKLWIDEGNYNNKPVYILQNSTRTLKEFEWIIRVNDYYASYVDKNTMKPERHIQKTLVDKYKTDYEYIFDYKQQMIFASIENSKVRKHMDTLKFNPCTHDLLSAAYYPRNIDFTRQKIGTKIILPVLLDTNTYNIYYKYLGMENIITKNKKDINCIKIVPLLVETSIFNSGEKMTVWLSSDKNKLPLRMESELRIGKIVLELISWKGLLHTSNY